MPAIPCYIDGCSFKTPDALDSAVAAVVLSHHLSSEHPTPAPKKAPAIPPPKLTGGVYEDQWDAFVREWDVYKGTVTISTSELPVHLLACCNPDLKSSVERADPRITSKSETDVLKEIKRHAVISVAASVLRTELFGMKQDHGETVLAFSSRALGKARNCKFTVACPHGDKTPHDYCEDMVKHIVLAGMYDEEIKRKVLSTSKIDDKTLNETIAIIETEEMASRSMSDISLPNQAGSTSYKKQISANDKRLQVKGKCISCDGDFLCNRVKKQAGKEDTVITDKFCKPCWQKKRDEKRRKNDSGKQEQRPTNEASVSTRSEEFPFICAVNSGFVSLER